ncbi:MAG: TIM barrel protein [Planctomycetota bacterium]
MLTGYHTAGLLLHDPCTALQELAGLGFRCVALRPHACMFNPAQSDFSERVVRLTSVIEQSQLQVVLDLDASFMQDPWNQHAPSLAAEDSTGRQKAEDWISRWLEVAAELSVSVVTFNSGRIDPSTDDLPERVLDRLVLPIERLLASADAHQIALALRPRGGEAIATVAQFERFGQWLDIGNGLRLAADVGEMLRGGELPLADRLARNLESLAVVYLCDRKAGTPRDQPIGMGDVDLNRLIRSLLNHTFDGPAIARVEGYPELGLSCARTAMETFKQAIPAIGEASES